jgi:glucose/mannose-6-phosphate isomerase
VSAILDDVAAFERTDPHDARGVLAQFPAQCRAGRCLQVQPALAIPEPSLVVVAGMGGSAASGDLLAACADELPVPVLVHRGYGLPTAARRGALVIISSYSGETAEALSAAEAAVTIGGPTVVVTAGGALGRLASAHRLARVTLPSGLMPRMALGYLFFPTLAILRGAGLTAASPADVDEALDVIEAVAKDVAPERPSALNEAKQLAIAVGDRLPVVYGGPTSGPCAYRWKTDFEENAKVFAAAGVLPEVNHNEIEAWQHPEAGGLHLVMLRTPGERPEIERRFALLREVIGPRAGGMSEVWARGRGRLARLLSLALLGQWVSYYLAVLRGTDPWTTPRLDEFKRRMAQR